MKSIVCSSCNRYRNNYSYCYNFCDSNNYNYCYS